jgi:hypothetical protein
MENLRWISKVADILPYVTQDSALCGEAHGSILQKMHTWGLSLQLQGNIMKTLATDRALVTSWLLAQAGLVPPPAPKPTAAPQSAPAAARR